MLARAPNNNASKAKGLTNTPTSASRATPDLTGQQDMRRFRSRQRWAPAAFAPLPLPALFAMCARRFCEGYSMADHTPTGPVEMGAKMDYAEHDRTYHRFLHARQIRLARLRRAAGCHGVRLLHDRRLLLGHRPFHSHLRGRLPSCSARPAPTFPAAAAAVGVRQEQFQPKGSCGGTDSFHPEGNRRERAARWRLRRRRSSGWSALGFDGCRRGRRRGRLAHTGRASLPRRARRSARLAMRPGPMWC